MNTYKNSKKNLGKPDHIHVVNQLKEKCREFNITLCIASVDYEKAFYSVQTPAVLTSLQEQGIEGHVSRIRDNRWTLRITTWKPHERKRPRGRPARRWRDELDDYWKSTIWQRIAQDRQMWMQHAEAFAQPRDTMAAQ
ncbi:hypothetical protein NP493_252g05078 [Ridgeia piscesae]|uniref:Reverse transcriptase domain-containing protein n=1 Tax=Ridgeia piscesae TaxID=27915 RepID=A0AAD9NYG2_RIDPI|nr:hypothetical protein NP493_252g05078 [Ridgeia piscesae]